MANRIQVQPLHLGQRGTPDDFNESSLPRGGELGQTFEIDQKSYQLVKLDSGATASNSVGVVAANQLAFWKDKTNYLVSNDKRMAQLGGTTGAVANSFANNVAGIFRTAVTAGYYCFILQRGNAVAVVETASSCTAGTSVIADTTANTASAAGVAVGTACTYQKLGVTTTAYSGSVAYINADIPSAP